MRLIKETITAVHFLVGFVALLVISSALGMTRDQSHATLGQVIISLVLLAAADLVITGPLYLASRRPWL